MEAVKVGFSGVCDCCHKDKGESQRLFVVNLPLGNGNPNETYETKMCMDCILDLRKNIKDTAIHHIHAMKKDIKKINDDFSNLQRAWDECASTVSSCLSVEINDFVCNDDKELEYPFDKSFDEISVFPWVLGIRQKCQTELAKLEEMEKKFNE